MKHTEYPGFVEMPFFEVFEFRLLGINTNHLALLLYIDKMFQAIMTLEELPILQLLKALEIFSELHINFHLSTSKILTGPVADPPVWPLVRGRYLKTHNKSLPLSSLRAFPLSA